MIAVFFYCPPKFNLILAVARHDHVATVLREHGAVLAFPGKQAGVLMCQVFPAHGFAKLIAPLNIINEIGYSVFLVINRQHSLEKLTTLNDWSKMELLQMPPTMTTGLAW